MAVFDRYMDQFKLQSEASLKGWLNRMRDRQQLPSGYSVLPLNQPQSPALKTLRPDLLPLCHKGEHDYLCAQLSPMGRVSFYGQWTAETGWSPWTEHWEALLVVLWARDHLYGEVSGREVDAWVGEHWRAVQEQRPGLPPWDEFAAQTGPQPLMTLLKKGVAAYPAVLWLSAYRDQCAEADVPEYLDALLLRERCRLWRTTDPSENSLQQVVKAVYAVQAMRRGEFDSRCPVTPYALNLSAVLQKHWAQVPEPLRDDHLIKAARDGRKAVLARAWQEEAVDCRCRHHHAEAYRALGQAWSVDADSVHQSLYDRWLADARRAESRCWETLLSWHGFVPEGESRSGPELDALLARL